MLNRIHDVDTRRLRWVVPSMLSVAALIPLLCLRHLRVIYTSDSAAQQSVLRTWLDVGHVTTYLPQDTWALKLPLYLVLENLPLSPRERLLTAALTLNTLTFLLLGWAAWALATTWGHRVRWYELAVPLTWLSTLGGGLGSNRLLTNYRNIELGLCFVVLAVTARYLGEPAGERRPRTRPALLGAGAALALSLLWFDDPYFSSLLALPLAAAALAWYLLRDRDARLLRLAGVMLGSLVIAQGLRVVAGWYGIKILAPPHTFGLAPAELARSLRLLLPSTRLLLGLDRWDGDLWWQLMRPLLVVALVLMLLAAAELARRGWRERRFVLTFVGLHWPVVVLGFVVSWYSQDPSAGRYLILAVYDLVVAAVLLLPQVREHRPVIARWLVGVLAAGAVLNLSTGLSATIGAARAPSEGVAHQQQIVAAVQHAVARYGAVKGYAPFWDANINTYLAGDRTTAVEIVCRDGRFGTRQWLSDSARLTRPASGPVFLIWDPIAAGLSDCPASVRDAQFGKPLAVYPVTPTRRPSPGGGVTAVLVYPGDLNTRLRP